jgi:hypothetical protein
VVDEVVLGQVFLPVLLFFSCQHHSTNAPYHFIYHRHFIVLVVGTVSSKIPTPWNRVFRGKLLVAHAVKKFSMEPESSLPCSHEFATFCYFSQMKRVRAAPFCLRSVLLSFNLCPMSFKWFLQVSLPKLCAFVSHTYHLLRPSDAPSFQSSYYTITITRRVTNPTSHRCD